MPEALATTLHRIRIDALLQQATTIRDYPSGIERTDHALRLVREAKLLRILDRISQREEHRIYTVLSFVMPHDAPAESERPPLDPADEWPTELEHEPRFDCRPIFRGVIDC